MSSLAMRREDTIGLEQRSEDQANGRIEGCDRGKVQPDVGLCDAMIENGAGHGAAPCPARVLAMRRAVPAAAAHE